MQLTVSKPPSFETVAYEAPRGGIGSRLRAYCGDEVGEDGGFRAGLGMGNSRIPMSTTTTVMKIVQNETPTGKGKKRRSEVDGAEMSRKPKRKSKNKAQVASD